MPNNAVQRTFLVVTTSRWQQRLEMTHPAPGMHLYLTNRSHLNSAYVNDNGQPLYKVETPNKFFNRVATIKRVLPGDLYPLDNGASGISNHRPSYETTNGDDGNDPVKSDAEYDKVPDEYVDEKDDIQQIKTVKWEELRFGHLAEITFNAISPSVLRFGGQEHQSSQLFMKKEFGWYGRNHSFTGPDGVEYQWILGVKAPELFRVNAEHDTTPVARFNRRRLGIFTEPRPASLEIFSEGMHMVDLIVITFVYIQKIRNDKERPSDQG